MWTVDTPLQEVADECWDIAKPQTGYESESQCSTILSARKMGRISFGKALPMMAAFDPDLVRWLAFNALDRMDSESRSMLLKALVEADYGAAAVLYVHSKDLTDSEDIVLEPSLDRMPNLKSRVKSSRVTRAKLAR